MKDKRKFPKSGTQYTPTHHMIKPGHKKSHLLINLILGNCSRIYWPLLSNITGRISQKGKEPFYFYYASKIFLAGQWWIEATLVNKVRFRTGRATQWNSVLKKQKLLRFMYTSILFTCMPMYHVHPETWIIDDCKLTCGHWKSSCLHG